MMAIRKYTALVIFFIGIADNSDVENRHYICVHKIDDNMSKLEVDKNNKNDDIR